MQGFREFNGVYLDSNFRPLYATPKFYETFQVNEVDFLSAGIPKILKHMDNESKRKVVEHLRKKSSEVSELELRIEGEKHKIEVRPKHLTDESGNVVGTFILFADRHGFFDRIFRSGKKGVKGAMLLDDIFDRYSREISQENLKPNIEQAS